MTDFISSFTGQIRDNWFEKFARFGLASKGAVYLLMGTLSVLAAFGLSREKGDKEQAFKLIYDQPFGKVILVAIAVGLLGYVMLRTFQAIKDTENKGNDAKGILNRIGYGMSALLYIAIGAYALKLVFGNGGDEGGDSRQFVVSKILTYPAGEYIVGIAGLIGIGMGIYQIARGISGRFMKKVNLLNSNMKDAFKSAGTIGYISRGIVLGIIGYFLIRAAYASNPEQAQGTRAAFDFLQNEFGSLMMAVVALGLAGYGVFCFVKAKYQKIDLDL